MPRSRSRSRRRRERSSRRERSRSRSAQRKAARSPSGGRGGRPRRREASRSREGKARGRSKSAARNRSPSGGRRTARSRSRAARKNRSKSRSQSRRVRRRSRSPDRVPPTEFGDYEPSFDGGGWYVYKRTGKWKYHPETGLYLHVKSKVYYVQKEGNSREFRKIEDDDDPVVRKMKQSEEMRKAIQKTEFVKFDESGNPATVEEQPPLEEVAVQKAPGPEPKPPELERKLTEEEVKSEGKVQKWDSEKGFGFIVPIVKEGEEAKGLFVHRKNIVGSTPTNPINLKEGGKVEYKPIVQDGRPCASEVKMLGVDGKPLPIHAGAQNLEEKKKSYYVTAESIGLRVHAESWPGLKKTLQDRYVADEAMEELGVYFAVFDGHGGTQVADHCSQRLHKNILQQFRQKQVQPASRDEKIRSAIKEAFIQTDKEIISMAERKKVEQVGSTAVVAMLHGNPKLGTALRLVVANLGDSRAVVCRGGQAVAASEDHKPTRIDEKKRIERAGGLVVQMRGTARIAAPANPNAMNKAARREYQGLAMTRSFGDSNFKVSTPLVIAEPEIQIIPLTDKDLFMVLATDGIFDVLPNQEVSDLVLRYWQDPEEAAKAVVRTAYKKGSEDNLTALVIQFGWSDKNAPKYLDKRRAALALEAAQEDGAPRSIAAAAAVTASAVDEDVNMFG